MINLLPEQEKKAMHSEYKFRLLAVALAGILILIILWIILLIPSFILAFYRSSVAESTVKMTASAHTTDSTGFADAITSAKLTASVLTPDTIVLPTTIIDILEKHRTSANKILSISYSLNEKGVFSIAVKGIAKTRQSLMQFTTDLKQEAVIASVDLPISNFVKDVDIEFGFTIIGK